MAKEFLKSERERMIINITEIESVNMEHFIMLKSILNYNIGSSYTFTTLQQKGYFYNVNSNIDNILNYLLELKKLLSSISIRDKPIIYKNILNEIEKTDEKYKKSCISNVVNQLLEINCINETYMAHNVISYFDKEYLLLDEYKQYLFEIESILHTV